MNAHLESHEDRVAFYRANFNPRFLARVRAKRQEASKRVQAEYRPLDDPHEKAVLAAVPNAKVRRIIWRICKATGVPVTAVLGPGRPRKVAFARVSIYYWSVRRTSLSYPQVGTLIGGRDHTSVLSGCRSYVRQRAAQGRALRPARG